MGFDRKQFCRPVETASNIEITTHEAAGTEPIASINNDMGNYQGEVRYGDWPPWQKEWDSNEEAYYYYNIWTHETTWIEPSGFYGLEQMEGSPSSKMPDGLLMLKAAKRVQSVYRTKVAKRAFQEQKRLKELIVALEIYDDRCDLWMETGEIQYRKKDYNAAASSLARAVSNVHLDNQNYHQDHSQEALNEKRRQRRQKNSEFSSFAYKKPERSEANKMLQRFTNRMKKLKFVGKINYGRALRMLGLCFYFVWEASCKPADLKRAWGCLLIANTFFENMTHPDFMFAIAKCHAANGSFEGALKLMGRVIDQMGTWHKIDEVICNAAAVLKYNKQWKDSLHYFAYVLESPYIKRKPFTLFCIQFEMAHIYLLLEDADSALAYFEVAMASFVKLNEIVDKDIGAEELQEKRLFRKQLQELRGNQKGRYDDTPEVYEFVGHSSTWFQLGRWCKALGWHVLAAEAFNEALARLSPSLQQSPTLWYEIAQAANRCGDVDSAMAWGKAALELATYKDGFSEHVREHLLSWSEDYRKEVSILSRSATVIQQMIRRVISRSKYMRQLEACLVIQRSIRIWLFWKHKRESEEKAQRQLRKFILRRAMLALNKWHEYTETMLKMRKLLGKIMGNAKREVIFEWRKIARTTSLMKKRRKRAASKMQRAYRAYCARTALVRAKKQREELEARARIQLRKFVMRNALSCLNNWWGYVLQSRKIKDLMKRVLNGTKQRFLDYWIEEWELIMVHKNRSATIIQAYARRMLARSCVAHLRARLKSALLIQNQWRIHQSAIFVRMIKLAKDKQLVDCTTRVQARWRGIVARRKMQHLHFQASQIQRIHRGILGRTLVIRKRRLRKQKKARKIQRVFRHYVRTKKVILRRRSEASVILQKYARRFLKRGLIAQLMETVQKHWAKLIINREIVDRPLGPDTERAIAEGGGRLVETIWKRYPCTHLGKIRQSAIEEDVPKVVSPNTLRKYALKDYKSPGSHPSRETRSKILPAVRSSPSSYYLSFKPETNALGAGRNLTKSVSLPQVRRPNKKIITFSPHQLLKRHNAVYNEQRVAVAQQMHRIKTVIDQRQRRLANRHDLFDKHSQVHRRLKKERVQLAKLLKH